jgi:phosphate uptake regulator
MSQNLSEQDEVRLFSHRAGTLCLRPVEEKGLLTKEIFLESKSSKEINRELIGAYIAGAEQIILTSYLMTPEIRQIVRNSTSKLAGFDIFESTSTKIVLKYTSNSTVSAKDYIDKSGRLVVSMLVDALEAIESKQRNLAIDVIESDSDIDKINLMISRYFNRFLTSLIPVNSDISLTTLNYYKHVSIRIERIADHIVRICTTFLQLKSKNDFNFSKAEINLTKKLIIDLQECILMIDEQSKKRAHQLIDSYEMIKKNAFINHKIVNQDSINILIQDSLERIRSYIANIAEETIDYCNIKELSNK